jgi:hypothetical protein
MVWLVAALPTDGSPFRADRLRADRLRRSGRRSLPGKPRKLAVSGFWLPRGRLLRYAVAAPVPRPYATSSRGVWARSGPPKRSPFRWVGPERHWLQCATAALQAAPCCSSINRALNLQKTLHWVHLCSAAMYLMRSSAPSRQSQVRSRLAAGGRRIRTLGRQPR